MAERQQAERTTDSQAEDEKVQLPERDNGPLPALVWIAEVKERAQFGVMGAVSQAERDRLFMENLQSKEYASNIHRALKIKLICENMEFMVNEKAMLTYNQRGTIDLVISAMAARNPVEYLYDSLDPRGELLALATYINSCSV